jgi:hypothetical protein
MRVSLRSLFIDDAASRDAFAWFAVELNRALRTLTSFVPNIYTSFESGQAKKFSSRATNAAKTRARGRKNSSSLNDLVCRHRKRFLRRPMLHLSRCDFVANSGSCANNLAAALMTIGKSIRARSGIAASH